LKKASLKKPAVISTLQTESCEATLSKTVRKLHFLLELGQLISLDLQLDDMLIQIARKATEVMEADRFTIFLYDTASDELWTTVAVGVEGKRVRIKANEGVAGFCFQTGRTVNLVDAYKDPRFYRQIDTDTDYRTRTLLSMPFYSRTGQPLGVIQLINKKEGAFTDEDETFLGTFNNHAAVFIEMAQLQKARIDALEQSRREVERVNRAKGKALDHLAHELRTPLALILGIVRLLRKKLGDRGIYGEFEGLIDTVERNVRRLLETQREADKIIRTYGRSMTAVPLLSFAGGVLEEVKGKTEGRNLTIELDGHVDPVIVADVRILKDVVTGLLKNAVENTPDEGLIQVVLEQKDGRVLFSVRDFGIGLTGENKAGIFDGLFHTQDTDLYGSKRPYEFYAGGKGLDLLLMKIYGQRFGFDISVESRRCVFLPTDRDLCPGRISLCPHCKGPETCASSGGTTFSVSFPVSGISPKEKGKGLDGPPQEEGGTT
jgi:signal transduction histidine kinase